MAESNFFGSLRNLAAKIDKETSSLNDQVTNRRGMDKPESAELLLLELQNEMKTLYVSVNRTLQEMKKNDDHFSELVPVCQTVVVQQAEKLAKIEEYLGKYGYIPPEVRLSGEQNNQTKSKNTGCQENSANLQKRQDHRDELEIKNNLQPKQGEESLAIESEPPNTMQTPKGQRKRNSDSSEDRTPQPEDFGLCSGNILKNHQKREKYTPNKEPCFKIPFAPQPFHGSNAFETPQNFQHRGLCVTPGLLGSEISRVTPAGNNYMTGARGEDTFDHQLPTLKFNCDSDGSPDTPVLRTPGFHGNMSRRDCQFGQEENTIALFKKEIQPPPNQAISSILEDDDWDSSPIPPVLTSGVVQIPKRDKMGISKFQLHEQNANEDNSPVAPVLLTPVAKQFQKKHNSAECSSEVNSPAVPELLTPGIKIPQRAIGGLTEYDKGIKCEENSPKFPALQSMNEDISRIEMPAKPTLSCTTQSDDDDEIPEPPELTTINLKALMSHLQMSRTQDNASRQVLGEIQDPCEFSREPMSMTSDTEPFGAVDMKENSTSFPSGEIPERLRRLTSQEYSSLTSYITRQLSLETIHSMTTEMNKILFKQKRAGDVEEINISDISKHLGDKTKMFILVMRQLGKLRVTSKGTEVTYEVV